jgi:hypothetical protein
VNEWIKFCLAVFMISYPLWFCQCVYVMNKPPKSSTTDIFVGALLFSVATIVVAAGIRILIHL